MQTQVSCVLYSSILRYTNELFLLILAIHIDKLRYRFDFNVIFHDENLCIIIFLHTDIYFSYLQDAG